MKSILPIENVLGEADMKKVITIFCAIQLMMILSLSIFVIAESYSDSSEKKYNDRIDREKKESNKMLNSISANSDQKIEENKEALDLEKNSKKTAALDNKPLENLGKNSFDITSSILYEVKRVSLPISCITIIAGSMMYFILGPRNLARKKYGQMLMFGGFTFWTLAQIAPVVIGLIT